MKSTFNLAVNAITSVILLLSVNFSFAQDDGGYEVKNIKQVKSQEGINTAPLYPQELEQRLAEARESGNNEEAERIMEEIYRMVPAKNISRSIQDPDDRCIKDIVIPESQNWLVNDKRVFNGPVHAGFPYIRQSDMKMGEDGNIYIAVNRAPDSAVFTGRIDVYRSADGGSNWILTSNVTSTTGYYSSVSMLVERRSPTNNDSTRIFVFYTKSSSSNNNDATLQFASWRRDGNAWYSGVIATPTAGSEFNCPSAISNGAFLNGATDIAVVSSLTDNAFSNSVNLVFYKSLDWGNTWIGVTASSIASGKYPSASFKPASNSSGDSIWIVVEKENEVQTDLYLVATPWTPTASFGYYSLTYVPELGVINHEKPVITIKQNRPCDSVMITFTGNGISYYVRTGNAGDSWINYGYLGGPTNGANKSFTWCSSTPEGDKPFIAIWVSEDGDSLNVRRGVLGGLGPISFNRNNHIASANASPTCVIYNFDSSNYCSAISYVGSGPSNVYFDQECLSTLIIKLTVIPQGLYDTGSGSLRMGDTVSVNVRNGISPYNILMNLPIVIDEVSFSGNNINPQNIALPSSVYVEVTHRNSISTWSQPITPTNDTINYDFTTSVSQAFGNNLIQVANLPVPRFAIYGGDVNQDGAVDATDVSSIDNDAANFVSGYVVTDLTGDNFVDGTDFAIGDNNAANFVSAVTP